MASFGTLVREHRKNAGLTQEQLAVRASMSSQAVGALERGTRRFPHHYTVARLADALGLDDEQRTAFAAAAFRPAAPDKQPPPIVQTGTASRVTPVINAGVCTSGRTTGQVCRQHVTDVDFEAYIDGVLDRQLAVFARDDHANPVKADHARAA